MSHVRHSGIAEGDVSSSDSGASRPTPDRRGSGFTLIELLVVIAIIALLVAILMPSLQQAKELAERAKCGVNLHNIGLALNMYAEEYNDWLPYSMCADGTSLMGIPDNGWAGVFPDPGGPNRLGMLYARQPGKPGAVWWEIKDFPRAEYVDDLDVLYCPGRKYVEFKIIDWYGAVGYNAGYSMCIPNSTFYHNTGGYQGRRREDIDVGWPSAYGRKFVAWVACYRDFGLFPNESPHRNIGVNCIYRDNSVRFVYRPDTGWGPWYAAAEAGTIYDDCPAWLNHLEPAFNH